MSAFSDYLESALLNHVLRANVGGAAFAQPASVWAGLFTVPTTDVVTTGGPAQGEVDPVGTGYARVEVTFTAPAGGQCANVAGLSYPIAVNNWGTISHVVIFDNAVVGAGNALFHGPIATPKTINLGDTFQFLAGQLIIGLN